MKSKVKSVKVSNLTSWDFVSVGLSCHALSLLKSLNILPLIKSKKFLLSSIDSYANKPLVNSTILTLISSKIIHIKEDKILFTSFGVEIINNIGAITLPFLGYRNLLSKQKELAMNTTDWKQKDLDFLEIAKASDQFGPGENAQHVIDLLNSRGVKNTICDLGCGTGEMLYQICDQLGTPGLGIDQNQKTIDKSRIRFKNTNPKMSFIRGDVTKIQGIWEDVQAVLLSYVFHDIRLNEKAENFLRELSQHFPRMSYLIVVDIVSYSERYPNILPGFDYIHGLQGFTPRTYEENLEVFERSNLQIEEEIEVPGMNNTFIWLLKKH